MYLKSHWDTTTHRLEWLKLKKIILTVGEDVEWLELSYVCCWKGKMVYPLWLIVWQFVVINVHLPYDSLFGLNCARAPHPPPKVCLSPNPQYLRMWPYLEIGSLQLNIRSYLSRDFLIQYDLCSPKKRRETRRIQRGEMDCWGLQTLTSAKKKTWSRFFPRSFKRAWPYQHLDFILLASRTGRE